MAEITWHRTISASPISHKQGKHLWPCLNNLHSLLLWTELGTHLGRKGKLSYIKREIFGDVENFCKLQTTGEFWGCCCLLSNKPNTPFCVRFIHAITGRPATRCSEIVIPLQISSPHFIAKSFTSQFPLWPLQLMGSAIIQSGGISYSHYAKKITLNSNGIHSPKYSTTSCHSFILD